MAKNPVTDSWLAALKKDLHKQGLSIVRISDIIAILKYYCCCEKPNRQQKAVGYRKTCYFDEAIERIRKMG